MMRVFSCLVAYLDFFLQNTCMLPVVVHEELPVLLGKVDRYGIALIEIAYCGDKVWGKILVDRDFDTFWGIAT